MPLNWYANRDALKDACGIAATATGDHDQLEQSLETASRLMDDWVGYHLFPAIETRYFTPKRSDRLSLNYPLLSVTALRSDAGGDSTYESTWATGDYYLNPANAPQASPPEPYWELETRQNSTITFPTLVRRGVELVGLFGQYDQRENSRARLATGINATATVFEVASATDLHPGQTVRLDDEQMFVSDVATTSGGLLTVQRAVNGTTGVAHTTATATIPQVYRYPIAERACLYQAQFDFRAGLADPVAGSVKFGESRFAETVISHQGDLHPAVKRMLRSLRAPVVG